MNLFSKDKELIHKITNAVLLIWFLVSIVVLFNSIFNLTFKEPVRIKSYEEYRVTCYDKENEESDKFCREMYEEEMFQPKRTRYYNKQALYITSVMVLVVGGAMVVLNKKESK